MRAFGFFCTGLVQGSSGGGASVFVNFVKHIFPAFHDIFLLFSRYDISVNRSHKFNIQVCTSASKIRKENANGLFQKSKNLVKCKMAGNKCNLWLAPE